MEKRASPQLPRAVPPARSAVIASIRPSLPKPIGTNKGVQRGILLLPNVAVKPEVSPRPAPPVRNIESVVDGQHGLQADELKENLPFTLIANELAAVKSMNEMLARVDLQIVRLYDVLDRMLAVITAPRTEKEWCVQELEARKHRGIFEARLARLRHILDAADYELLRSVRKVRHGIAHIGLALPEPEDREKYVGALTRAAKAIAEHYAAWLKGSGTADGKRE
jgi:hypothetical protein